MRKSYDQELVVNFHNSVLNQDASGAPCFLVRFVVRAYSKLQPNDSWSRLECLLDNLHCLFRLAKYVHDVYRKGDAFQIGITLLTEDSACSRIHGDDSIACILQIATHVMAVFVFILRNPDDGNGFDLAQK